MLSNYGNKLPLGKIIANFFPVNMQSYKNYIYLNSLWFNVHDFENIVAKFMYIKYKRFYYNTTSVALWSHKQIFC